MKIFPNLIGCECSQGLKTLEGSASLDRIDSSMGYIRGNVQWLLKDINMMKQQFPQSHFIEMCHLVSKTNA